MPIKRINVDGEGLQRYFGTLEAKIMELLWASAGMSIRDVQSVLQQESPITVNAVMTVMNRLVEKGHLLKSSGGFGKARGAVYRPALSREAFLAEQMHAVSQGLIQEHGSLVVAHMIDMLDEADPEIIARLERKLNEMKQGKPL
ncbi:BlaI/MecI/CopY family transcriptional regulator [Paenibacillus sp. NFR01]|uniref:BlaI/MecI/CopY family transcriptional regulator n=1 Tax=Paenibacillus sp. NFR01 TaxID=1566279 RepID=UPI0008B27EA2|nr:BlaI/MecI/CopY family transcriptional regulator [Paenibacillus sp. NFR01]SEU28227.1 Predicted transcriptional regulator [Paenibacillus sp. NFR01]